MSDNHIPEHSSPIKTPKQLAIVVLLAFILPVVIIVMLAQIATTGKTAPADSAAAEEAVAKRLKPAGEVFVDPNAPPPAPAEPVAVAAAPGAAPAAAAPAGSAGKGKGVYDTSCAACHSAGVAGAPKTGDKAAWSARLKAGTSALVATAIKGKGAMPPKGGNMSLSDDDIKAAVEFMVSAAK